MQEHTHFFHSKVKKQLFSQEEARSDYFISVCQYVQNRARSRSIGKLLTLHNLYNDKILIHCFSLTVLKAGGWSYLTGSWDCFLSSFPVLCQYYVNSFRIQ